MITYTEKNSNTAKIMVIGVGGGGNNAVNQMIKKHVDTVTFVAVNTDMQALQQSRVVETNRLQIGKLKTEGLGAGSDPEIGKIAAEESTDEIKEVVQGMHLVFVVCGMGGGTGTGASPVIAKIAKDSGALVVGVVTTPFAFEGARRQANAKKGIEQLAQYVDSMIIIPNNKLLTEIAKDRDLTIVDAFEMADEVLRQGIIGISNLIVKPGLINLDFADIKAVLKNQGLAHMGIGRAKGENKIYDAVCQAVRSPLLETSIEGAKGLILNICGGKDLSLVDVGNATGIVKEALDENANIIFGTDIDENLKDEVTVTLIATGFKTVKDSERKPVKPTYVSEQSVYEVPTQPKSETVEERPSTQTIKEYPRRDDASLKTESIYEEKEDRVEEQAKTKKPPAFLRRIFGKSDKD